jgi:hypothetical protein
VLNIMGIMLVEIGKVVRDMSAGKRGKDAMLGSAGCTE